MSRNARIFGLIGLVLCLLAGFSPWSVGGETPRLSTSMSVSPRARVVVVEDAGATEAYKPVPEKVDALVQRGITRFTGKPDIGSAWRSLVKTQEVVGIKVLSFPGPQAGTRLSVVEGVVRGLRAANVPGSNIVVWDRRLSDLQRAGYGALVSRHGIRLAGAVESGWDDAAWYESSILGYLVFNDHEFQKTGEAVGRKSFVSKLVTREIKKIINIPPLLNHNTAGVCGNLYSLAMGSIDNSLRFEGDAGKLAQAVPEIYALEPLADRVVLNIVDALVCQYQGEQVEYLHYSTPLNQLRFSADPVALDVLSVEDLQRARKQYLGAESRTNRLELYRNAEFLELGITDLKRIDVDTRSLK